MPSPIKGPYTFRDELPPTIYDGDDYPLAELFRVVETGHTRAYRNTHDLEATGRLFAASIDLFLACKDALFAINHPCLFADRLTGHPCGNCDRCERNLGACGRIKLALRKTEVTP